MNKCRDDVAYFNLNLPLIEDHQHHLMSLASRRICFGLQIATLRFALLL